MKTTLLFTALLCGSAQANLITVDIEGNTTPIGRYTDPNANVTGSYTVPGSQYSPEFNFHADTLDWRPFGATFFTAGIHGSFSVATPGTGRFDLYWAPSLLGAMQSSDFKIDGITRLYDSFESGKTTADITLNAGTHTFDLWYTPPVAETIVLPNGYDVATLPTGKNGIAIIDEDHPWGPTSSVPESSWLCWLLPLGLLLWRRK